MSKTQEALKLAANINPFGSVENAKARDAAREALADQPAQYSDIVSDGGFDPRNKFDVPPQRKPLTMNELHSLREHQELLKQLGPVWAPMLYYFCAAIEAAHGIKP